MVSQAERPGYRQRFGSQIKATRHKVTHHSFIGFFQKSTPRGLKAKKEPQLNIVLCMSTATASIVLPLAFCPPC